MKGKVWVTVKLSSLGPREWDQGGPAQGGRLAQLLPLVILLVKAVARDIAFLTGTRLFAWGGAQLRFAPRKYLSNPPFHSL